MGYPFPSEGWLLALEVVLNHDEQYARVARNWEGEILCLVEQDDGPGVLAGLFMDLWHGQCRSAIYFPSEAGEFPKAKFVLRSPLRNFYRIVAGDLDPMQAMMTRRLRVDGNMAYMLRNVPTVLDFVRCCQQVEIDPKPERT
jgi:putative sterol carrier protein